EIAVVGDDRGFMLKKTCDRLNGGGPLRVGIDHENFNHAPNPIKGCSSLTSCRAPACLPPCVAVRRREQLLLFLIVQYRQNTGISLKLPAMRHKVNGSASQ